MGILPGPRLDYKPTSNVVFRHGDLLDELRDIREHHQSWVNQVIHIMSMSVAYIFAASTVVLIGKIFTLSIPVLILVVVAFFPLPLLAFYWYLDPMIAALWMPYFTAALIPSFFVADGLTDFMPRYAAIPTSLGLGLLALVPQLFGHLLLENVRSPACEPFEFAILTPFFLGYCLLGWLSCWCVRKETIEKIWNVEDCADVVDP